MEKGVEAVQIATKFDVKNTDRAVGKVTGVST
jgi:hypothetical protein